jgi:flagellar biogenesis protein FliO
MDAELMREGGAIVLVFSLLAGGLWSLRRAGGSFSHQFRAGTARRGWLHAPFLGAPNGRTRVLRTIERLALAPQHSLHLVRTGSGDLLIAVHPHGCTLLAEFPEPGAHPAPAAQVDGQNDESVQPRSDLNPAAGTQPRTPAQTRRMGATG